MTTSGPRLKTFEPQRRQADRRHAAAASDVAAIIAKGKNVFVEDRTQRLAVERLLEIIGEAARAMSDGARAAYLDIPWDRPIGLRTLLVHAYHRIDPEQLWEAASRSVPDLVRQLQSKD